MLVFQDGRDFYRDSDGECILIFTAPTFVADFDKWEAIVARTKFEDFAKRENLKFTYAPKEQAQ